MSPHDVSAALELAGEAAAEPGPRVDTLEDDIINELAGKIIRREKLTKPITAEPIGADNAGMALKSFNERLERVESIAMKTQRRFLVAVAIGAIVIVLLSISMIVRRDTGPSLKEMDDVFNRNLKQPIEKLEHVIDRLDRRLEAAP